MSDDLTFLQLHTVLQVAFGWCGGHLYSYDVAGYFIEFDPKVDNAGVQELNVEDTKLCDLPLEEGMDFEYVYDLGDNWEHTITIEKIAEKGPKYPVCEGGEYNCPPEDCGGTAGYLAIMEQINAGTVDAGLAEWLDEYDPNEFEIDEVNEIFNDPSILDEDFFDFE